MPQHAQGSVTTRLKCAVSTAGGFFWLSFLLWACCFSKRCDCRDSFPVRPRDIGERRNGFFCGFNGTLQARRVRFIQPFSVEVGRTNKKGARQTNAQIGGAVQKKRQSAKSFLSVFAGNLVMGEPVFSTPKLFHGPELGRAISDRDSCQNSMSRCGPKFFNRDRIGHQSAPSR